MQATNERNVSFAFIANLVWFRKMKNFSCIIAAHYFSWRVCVLFRTYGARHAFFVWIKPYALQIKKNQCTRIWWSDFKTSWIEKRDFRQCIPIEKVVCNEKLYKNFISKLFQIHSNSALAIRNQVKFTFNATIWPVSLFLAKKNNVKRRSGDELQWKKKINEKN